MAKAEVLTISLLKDFSEHSNRIIFTFQIIKQLRSYKEGIKIFMHKYNFKRFYSSLNYQNLMNVYLGFLQKMA